LLRSHPGGFSGAGCLGLAVAKIKFNIELKNEKHRIFRFIIPLWF